MKEALQIQEIHKSFPGVHVLKGITFSVEPGKMYSLVGENGAGKSTLIKIIMGLEKADSGEIFVKGRQAKIESVFQARKDYSIGAVFQECSLVPEMTIAENMSIDSLGSFSKSPLIPYAKLNASAREALQAVNMDLDVTQKVSKLSVGEKNIVELAKVLSWDPDIIILDEITAALEYEKVDELFEILNRFKEKGKAIIFISHRMEEVLRFADEIIVLKEGVLSSHLVNTEKKDTKEMRKVIIEAMTGITGGIDFPDRPDIRADADLVFEARHLYSDHLKDINIKIRKGEILCLAGLSGQGQSTLLRALAGDLRVEKGDILIDGKKIAVNTIRDAMQNGIFYISDKRDTEEIWGEQDLTFNTVLASSHKRSRGGVISKKGEREQARRMVDKLKIETPNLQKLIRYLSGGNRQKVVIGRYLLASPKLLILNQPTIGLDITTKIEIYRLLRELADSGMACLALFTERDEILLLPDRLVVMYEGETVAEFDGKTVTENDLVRSYYK